MAFSSADITHEPIDVIAVLENKQLPKEERLQRALSILEAQPELLNEKYEKERKEQKPIRTTLLLVNAIYQVQSNEDEEQRNTYAEFFFRVLGDPHCLPRVNLNLVDLNGNTALHLAARYARIKEEPQVGKEQGILTKMALKLLEKGAKTNLKNNNGHTVLTANSWLLPYIDSAKPDSIVPDPSKQTVRRLALPASEVKPTLAPTPAPVLLPVAPAAAAVSVSVAPAPAASTASIGSSLGLQAMSVESEPEASEDEQKLSFSIKVASKQMRSAGDKVTVSTRVVDPKQQALDAIKAEANSMSTSKLGKFGCFRFRPKGMGAILKLKEDDGFDKLLRILEKRLSKNLKRRDAETQNKYQEWNARCQAAIRKA